MIQRDADMLTQAIERNSAAVLSLPSAGMVRYYKSRFLRCVDHRIWLEGVPEEQKLIQSLIQDALPVMVSFKVGQRKVTFSSPIFELDDQYRFFDTQAPVQAVMMHWPAVVKPLQRRTYFRVPVRESDGFTIGLWRIAEQADLKDEPKDLFYVPAAVQDLSVGGVGVIFDKRPLLVENQRMRILLKHGDAKPMLLEGRSGPVSHDQANGYYETGIEFQGLQSSLEGRRILTELTRIVAGLQLHEARRLRGMSA